MRPGALKPAKQSVSRLETGLDRQELLLQRTASALCNLGDSLPSCLAAGFNDLAGGGRVARKVLCARKKEKEEKNTKSENELKRQVASKDEEEGALPSTKSSIWP